MANIKSALKRIRQTEKRTERNKHTKSTMRTYAKKVLVAVEKGDHGAAMAALKEATSVIDTTAQKGVIHKKHAARRIKRLNAAVKAIA